MEPLPIKCLSSNELISREFFDYRFQKQKFFLSGTHFLSEINYFYYETKSYFMLERSSYLEKIIEMARYEAPTILISSIK